MSPKNTYTMLPGKLVQIALTQGFSALINLVDLPLVAPYRWCVSSVKGRHYARCYGKKRQYMHRLILVTSEVDHRNGDGLDNRRCNLRKATHRQNMQNSSCRSHNKSGYKGVVFDESRSLFRATIRVDGKQRHLGRFPTADEAARTYDKVAKAVFGVYARPNFLDS